MKKKTIRRLLYVSGAVLLGSAVVILIMAYAWVPYRMSNPRAFSTRGPGNVGVATFFEYSGRATKMDLFAKSTDEEDDEDVWIGTVDWPFLTFREAFWSRDGTILAVRCTKHELPPAAPHTLFTHAYDFSTRRRLAASFNISNTTPAARSAEIESLLSARGGKVSIVCEDDVSDHFSPISWLEWRGLKKLQAEGMRYRSPSRKP